VPGGVRPPCFRVRVMADWYVDGALGTDDLDHGADLGVDAFRSLYYAAVESGLPDDGDTIRVAPGTYDENVIINKSLTLISDTGDYRTTGTILTGSGRIFTLGDGVDNITIQGFRFENVSHPGGQMSVIHAVYDGNNIAVRSNSFTNIGEAAMFVSGPSRSGWLITDNKIDGVTGTNESGLWLHGLSDSEISNNEISNTAYAGMILDALHNVEVKGNTITNTPRKGIQVANSPDSNVVIERNYITNTNTSHDEDEGAITIYPNVTNIRVAGNILTGNYQGFTVRDKAGVVVPDVHVNLNNIYGNDGFGVGNFAQGGGLLDATFNWWGDATGPSGEGAGAGDPVTDHVLYRPLTAPVEEGKAKVEVVTGASPSFPNPDAGITLEGSDLEYSEAGVLGSTRLSSTPATATAFQNGTRLNPLRFIDVFASGFSGGKVKVTLTFTEADLIVGDQGIDPTSLRVCLWYGDAWHHGENGGVNIRLRTVWATFNVTDLYGTPGGLGGAFTTKVIQASATALEVGADRADAVVIPTSMTIDNDQGSADRIIKIQDVFTPSVSNLVASPTVDTTVDRFRITVVQGDIISLSKADLKGVKCLGALKVIADADDIGCFITVGYRYE